MSAEFETTFFNDIFNILNQKQVIFFSGMIMLFWFLGCRSSSTGNDGLEIFKNNIEELIIEKLTPEEW